VQVYGKISILAPHESDIMTFFQTTVFLPRLPAVALALLLAACSAVDNSNLGSMPQSEPPIRGNVIGSGSVKAALIIPFSASGNAGTAGRAMRNAAEMALAEFSEPNVQILIKDDGGTPQGAQAAVQSALNEGAEIILGPLFSPAVAAAGQAASSRNVPVIAFSSDSNVAARGVYLLSFLPQGDVARVVDHALRSGKKSFAALLPDSAYGSVVEGAFQEAVARGGGRVIVLERYGQDKAQQQEAVKRVAAAAPQADALFLPDGPDTIPELVAALNTSGLDTQKILVLGTGQWDDPRIRNETALTGAVFAAPDGAGFRDFSARYSQRFGTAPTRTATLAYDAALLVAALTKTQGEARFSEATLTSPSGFQGIDGLFRFRADGSNERGLAILQVQAGAARVISPAPRSFGSE
jgi:branched-chain amino acid transport system substrate-binding protein